MAAFVVWMQRTGQLPADTPVVLSQVAFRVFIPCFLMSKVSLTLASHPSASLLALPLIAIAQVCSMSCKRTHTLWCKMHTFE
jgi:predicted permease